MRLFLKLLLLTSLFFHKDLSCCEWFKELFARFCGCCMCCRDNRSLPRKVYDAVEPKRVILKMPKRPGGGSLNSAEDRDPLLQEAQPGAYTSGYGSMEEITEELSGHTVIGGMMVGDERNPEVRKEVFEDLGLVALYQAAKGNIGFTLSGKPVNFWSVEE